MEVGRGRHERDSERRLKPQEGLKKGGKRVQREVS